MYSESDVFLGCRDMMFLGVCFNCEVFIAEREMWMFMPIFNFFRVLKLAGTLFQGIPPGFGRFFRQN